MAHSLLTINRPNDSTAGGVTHLSDNLFHAETWFINAQLFTLVLENISIFTRGKYKGHTEISLS